MENMTNLRNKINENGISEDSVWQSILDVGFNEWNREGSEVNSYEDMVDWVRTHYGDFAATVVLAGKFNQQVCNGGHAQYYDNGYASHGGGCFNNHGEDIQLHNELVDGMEILGMKTATKLSATVYDIMADFKVELDEEEYVEESCFECGGSGWAENPDYDYDDEDSEEDETIECSDCGGSGYTDEYNENCGSPDNTSEWDSLDSRYYAVDEKWVAWFEKFVTKKVMG